MSNTFRIESDDLDRLLEAIKRFQGDSEQVINDVLHNEGDELIQRNIRLLIPESGKTWKGKATPAKSGNSLSSMKGNLYVIEKTTKRYQYLYFPNDGTNTRNHIGNQQFFLEGAENASGDIIDRCIERLTNKFEEGA